jgi:ribose transport system ATP-binding protein
VPLLSVSGLSKRFGATQALEDVSLELHAGEVHALIGENGAGKSTLMKMLTGVHQPQQGSLQLDGQPYRPRGPSAARTAGVAMIYQELNLAPHLSVEANIMLGQEVGRAGWVRKRHHQQKAREAMLRLSRPEVPLNRPVGELPIAIQQLVEIARALVSDARVLVFDEPTSSLSEEDSRHLFQVIRDLKQAGLGVIYISHFLEEVINVADVYTVLRDGRRVGHGQMQDVTLEQVVHQMVGRELTELFPKVAHQPGETLLTLDDLSALKQPRHVNLELRRGEILGLAGLIGAGRSELVRAIFGLHPIRSGKVTVAKVGPIGQNPRHSIRRGVGLVSEDRKEEGLALSMSIVDNLTLSRLGPYARGGMLNLSRRQREAQGWLHRVHCKAAGPGQPIEQLSGGNQQKIALARLLHQEADLLLLDEPTRGVDVGTKAEIYRLIGELAAGGKAIILVSSYLPELMNVCDTIGVMCRGRLVEVRPAGQWSEEEVMHRATGVETKG